MSSETTGLVGPLSDGSSSDGNDGNDGSGGNRGVASVAGSAARDAEGAAVDDDGDAAYDDGLSQLPSLVSRVNDSSREDDDDDNDVDYSRFVPNFVLVEDTTPFGRHRATYDGTSYGNNDGRNRGQGLAHRTVQMPVPGHHRNDPGGASEDYAPFPPRRSFTREEYARIEAAYDAYYRRGAVPSDEYEYARWVELEAFLEANRAPMATSSGGGG